MNKREGMDKGGSVDRIFLDGKLYSPPKQSSPCPFRTANLKRGDAPQR